MAGLERRLSLDDDGRNNVFVGMEQSLFDFGCMVFQFF
jgi:hypothetical protein